METFHGEVMKIAFYKGFTKTSKKPRGVVDQTNLLIIRKKVIKVTKYQPQER